MDSDLDQLKQMNIEWDKWQQLWNQLIVVGAITDEDAKATKAKRDTPGLELIHLIQEWGEELVKLREELVEKEPNDQEEDQ